MFVTNTNNSGPGSLRDACEASGRRIVVFRVGGTITLSSAIIITDPFITIAGQTAPGDGICIRNSYISIQTHDVIIRGIRIRPGDQGAINLNQKGILMQKGAYNIIIDHCSLSWTVDQLLATFNSYAKITIQNCYLTEPLHDDDFPNGTDGRGFATGPDDPDSSHAYHGNATFYANLIAHSQARNPRVRSSSLEVINNLVYNFAEMGCRSDEETEIDFIGNHYIAGANTITATVTLRDATPATRIYVLDNIAPERPNGTGDEWLVVNASTQYRSFTRMNSSGLMPMSSSAVYEYVLANAGAFPRDPVDARVEGSVRNRTGTIISSQNQVGGWPVYASGTAPADLDNDGMSDAWETANGLNPSNPADANLDRNGDGYTNIEEYVNSLVGPACTTPTSNFSWTRSGLTVQFTSLATNATSYLWDFADGTTSTQQNPIHTFPSERSYRVKLTATNACGSAMRQRWVNLRGTVSLTTSPVAFGFGEVPLNTTLQTSVTATNAGEDSIEVESISFVTDNPTAFGAGTASYPLAPGDSADIPVWFSPVTTGDQSASLLVIAGEDTSVVAVTGTGLEEASSYSSQKSAAQGNAGTTVAAGEIPHHNYPNPFNSSTMIYYSLRDPAAVSVRIYSLLGEEVATLFEGDQQPGDHALSWNGVDSKGKQVSSGIYLYRILSGNISAMGRMMLMR
jgi:PKD repeat protein/pectate lyase